MFWLLITMEARHHTTRTLIVILLQDNWKLKWKLIKSSISLYISWKCGQRSVLVHFSLSETLRGQISLWLNCFKITTILSQLILSLNFFYNTTNNNNNICPFLCIYYIYSHTSDIIWHADNRCFILWIWFTFVPKYKRCGHFFK